MKLVGATRQALGEFSQAIDFPVAVDQLTTGAALATPENIEALTETIPDFVDRLPKSEQAALRQKVNAYLRQHAKTSATFTLNHLPGTRPFF